MKLFKILVTHYAPRDEHTAIQEYVVANNDREVFDYLADGYADWRYILDDCDNDDDYDYKRMEYEQIYLNKFDERDVYDLFYGATRYGWEEVEVSEFRKHTTLGGMISCGIAKDIRTPQVNECITYAELGGYKPSMVIMDEMIDSPTIEIPKVLRIHDGTEITLQQGNTTIKQDENGIEIKIKK